MENENPQSNNVPRGYFDDHNHDGVNSQKVLQSSFVTATLPNTDPATAANYGIFFTATRPCAVKAISEVHTTAGTNVGAVTLQIERLTGTQAPDAGTVLLATAFNLKGTANTVQRGALIASGLVGLKLGDRLCLKDAGTLTSVAGLNVTVELTYL